MFFGALKRLVSLLVSLALVAVVGFGIYISQVCRLDDLDGERVFYLDSASSQGLRKEELSLLDFARIEGESVRFAREGESAEALSVWITKIYGAEVLFTEEAAGVTSYYCYTPDWKNDIAVSGQRVNLHIAVSEEECVVGTPIIFDGF